MRVSPSGNKEYSGAAHAVGAGGCVTCGARGLMLLFSSFSLWSADRPPSIALLARRTTVRPKPLSPRCAKEETREVDSSSVSCEGHLEPGAMVRTTL